MRMLGLVCRLLGHDWNEADESDEAFDTRSVRIGAATRVCRRCGETRTTEPSRVPDES